MKILVSLIIISAAVQLSAQDKKSLTDLQELTLAENPRIIAMQKEAEMAEKKIPQSTSLDDPKLKLAVNNLPTGSFSFTMEDMTTKEIGVTQMIPIGKFSSRKQLAVKEHELALEKYRLEKTEILHELRMNIYELMSIRSTAVILEDIKKTIKLVIDSEIAANKSGGGSLQNVIKANIEYGMIDEELISLRQKETADIRKIKYLTGTDIDIDTNIIPPLRSGDISAEEAAKAIESGNPGLKIARLSMEISRTQREQKKDEYYPDVELGFSYMQRQDGNGKKRDDMVSGMVTFNIPVWSATKNSAMISEMDKKSDASKALYSDKLNELNQQSAVIISNITKWRALHELYSRKIIPQTELALETSMARYRSNAGDFASVMDTIRTLFRYRKELITSLTEYHTAYSELNKLMGVEVLK